MALLKVTTSAFLIVYVNRPSTALLCTSSFRQSYSRHCTRRVLYRHPSVHQILHDIEYTATESVQTKCYVKNSVWMIFTEFLSHISLAATIPTFSIISVNCTIAILQFWSSFHHQYGHDYTWTLLYQQGVFYLDFYGIETFLLE